MKKNDTYEELSSRPLLGHKSGTCWMPMRNRWKRRVKARTTMLLLREQRETAVLREGEELYPLKGIQTIVATSWENWRAHSAWKGWRRDGKIPSFQRYPNQQIRQNFCQHFHSRRSDEGTDYYGCFGEIKPDADYKVVIHVWEFETQAISGWAMTRPAAWQGTDYLIINDTGRSAEPCRKFCRSLLIGAISRNPLWSVTIMSKAMKQKLKERRQQWPLSAESVTGFTAEQSCCFEDAQTGETLLRGYQHGIRISVNSDEQSEFDQYDERDSTISCESVSAEMARENLKSKLVAMRAVRSIGAHRTVFGRSGLSM